MIGAVKPVRLISLKVLDVYKFCLSQIMSVYESGISAARTDVSETGNFVLSDIVSANVAGNSAMANNRILMNRILSLHTAFRRSIQCSVARAGMCSPASFPLDFFTTASPRSTRASLEKMSDAAVK
jgi:hypothetical protein